MSAIIHPTLMPCLLCGEPVCGCNRRRGPFALRDGRGSVIGQFAGLTHAAQSLLTLNHQAPEQGPYTLADFHGVPIFIPEE